MRTPTVEPGLDSSGITTSPLPASRKIYVQGSRHGIRVPMREIRLSPTRHLQRNIVEENPPLAVYDTSGPYTDQQIGINIRKGLAPLRQDWTAGRGDAEQLTQISS